MQFLKNKPMLLLVVVLVLMGAVLYVFGGTLKSLKNKIKSTLENHQVNKAEIETTDSGGNRTTVNLQHTATGIYSAFYGNLFGAYEDEDLAIELLLKVPKSEINALNRYYGAINNKGKSIFTDFRKYLSNSDFKKVSHLVG